jgi:hypothetical protein
VVNFRKLTAAGATLLCATISLSSAGAFAAESSATGSIGIRIVQIPDSVKDDPRSGYYIVARLLANEVFSQRIEISNSTSNPASINVYPAAATNVNGVFLPAAGNTQNQLTSWTVVSPSNLIIPAGSYADVNVTISVPAQVTNGAMYGVIWASDSGAPNSAGIVSINRVGIRMYDEVGPPQVALKTSGKVGVTVGGSLSSVLFIFMAVPIVFFILVFLFRRRRREELVSVMPLMADSPRKTVKPEKSGKKKKKKKSK